MNDIGSIETLGRAWLETRVQALVPDEAEIGPDENLLFLGLDSLSVLKLVAELKQAGITVSARELLQEPSIEGWWRLIQARRR